MIHHSFKNQKFEIKFCFVENLNLNTSSFKLYLDVFTCVNLKRLFLSGVNFSTRRTLSSRRKESARCTSKRPTTGKLR